MHAVFVKKPQCDLTIKNTINESPYIPSGNNAVLDTRPRGVRLLLLTAVAVARKLLEVIADIQHDTLAHSIVVGSMGYP